MSLTLWCVAHDYSTPVWVYALLLTLLHTVQASDYLVMQKNEH